MCGFIDDDDKMYDFYRMSKNDFLNFYSYLTEDEYERTIQQLEECRHNYNNR